MRVILADDHPMVRDAFKLYIAQAEPGAEVVAVATLDEALKEAVLNPDVDVVVLDLRMPGMNGIQGLQIMQKSLPNVPVVLMSGNADQREVQAALAHGARGFLPKTLSGKAMINALRLVMSGEAFVPYAIANASPGGTGLAEAPPAVFQRLPPSETVVRVADAPRWPIRPCAR